MTLQTERQTDSSVPSIRKKRARVVSSAGTHLRDPRGVHKPGETDIVRYMVENSARTLELCYWSMEPDSLEVLRAFVALPPEVQTGLRMFLASSPDLRLICATVQDGTITLFSPCGAIE
jgi:hypothetical protein